MINDFALSATETNQKISEVQLSINNIRPYLNDKIIKLIKYFFICFQSIYANPIINTLFQIMNNISPSSFPTNLDHREVASNRLIIIDKENKIVSNCTYLRDVLNFNNIAISRGILFINYKIDGDDNSTDAYFTYVPFYNCNQSLDNHYLNMKNYYSSFYKELYNITDRINIIECLDTNKNFNLRFTYDSTYNKSEPNSESSNKLKIGIKEKTYENIVNNLQINYNSTISGRCSTSKITKIENSGVNGLKDMINRINGYLNIECITKLPISAISIIDIKRAKKIFNIVEGINFYLDMINMGDIIMLKYKKVIIYKLDQNKNYKEIAKYKLDINEAKPNIEYIFILNNQYIKDKIYGNYLSIKDFEYITNINFNSIIKKFTIKILFSSYNFGNILFASIVQDKILFVTQGLISLMPLKPDISNLSKTLIDFYLYNMITDLFINKDINNFNKWINISISMGYFNDIRPQFSKLQKLLGLENIYISSKKFAKLFKLDFEIVSAENLNNESNGRFTNIEHNQIIINQIIEYLTTIISLNSKYSRLKAVDYVKEDAGILLNNIYIDLYEYLNSQIAAHNTSTSIGGGKRFAIRKKQNKLTTKQKVRRYNKTKTKGKNKVLTYGL